MLECTAAPEDASITEHREVSGDSTITLEYKVGNEWVKADALAVSVIRAYELKQLRRRPNPNPADNNETCNRDERKGIAETCCGRKSSGILAAVTPCLQIAAGDCL